jgi:hypothetical protein
MADDARVVLVADVGGILHVDPEAHHEALVAQDVHGRLGGREVEEGDARVRGLGAQRRRGPGADQAAGLEVVGGEGRVCRIRRIERRVERDHENAGLAGAGERVDDRLRVGGGDQDALGAGRHAAFDGRDLAFMVAVHLAREGLEVDAELGRLRRGAFAHLHEEGVGVGLGDEAGGRLLRQGRAAEGERGDDGRGRNERLHGRFQGSSSRCELRPAVWPGIRSGCRPPSVNTLTASRG